MFTYSRRPLRFLTLVTLTGLGLLAAVGTASAHVTVHANGTVTAGSYATITFQVPAESAKADTDALTVDFPQDHPFASVSVRKLPGWTAKVTKTKLATPITDDDHLTITEAVSSITWTADASAKLALGEFATFDVSVGPVPEVASMSFPTVQSYDDGSVVNWNEATPASGAEPEHPAPTLKVSPAIKDVAPVSDVSAASSSAAPTESSAPTATVTVTSSAPSGVAEAAPSSDGTARALGVTGIVVGALGVLAAAFAFRRRSTGAQ